MIKNIQDLEIFIRLIERKSFSDVSDELNMSVSQISKSLKRLENQTQTRLINRSTRYLNITPEGEKLYRTSTEILSSLDRLNKGIHENRETLHGDFKIAAPTGFGRHPLQETVLKFMRQHEDLNVTLNLTNYAVDMFGDKYDAVIYRPHFFPSTHAIIEKKLAQFDLVPVAAPSYIEKHGLPEHPDDLRHHKCLFYADNSIYGPLYFIDKAGNYYNLPENYRLICNTGTAIKSALLEGMGVSWRIFPNIKEELSSGKLIRILPEYTMTPSSLSVYYPANNFLPRKTHLFVGILTEEMKKLSDKIAPEFDHTGKIAKI